jgi:N,N-dimethylformamidase
VQLLHAGSARSRASLGYAVGPPVELRPDLHSEVPVRLYDWPTGVYLARVQAGSRVRYAPFVLRPLRFGTARAAVVVPTFTWQAYNVAGRDSWYVDPAVNTVDLRRPFPGYGLPPHFRAYDLGFLRWLSASGHAADFYSDADLDGFRSAERLAESYDLVVFAGHEEYVTSRMYDLIERYRDLGGNLAFLSANNFFWRVAHKGDRIVRMSRWRDLNRPEAALVGEQYVAWNENRFANAPYVVTGAQVAPWLFDGTGLRNGSRFGRYGIEIDGVTRDSPHGTKVLAKASDVFGKGQTAEMSYYETSNGARVFAAGVINFGGTADWPAISPLVENLWRRLTTP